MAEPWWSYLDEKEYRSRKASEFRVKAEDFFKQKRQPEVPTPEPEKEGGGGGLLGLGKGLLGGVGKALELTTAMPGLLISGAKMLPTTFEAAGAGKLLPPAWRKGEEEAKGQLVGQILAGAGKKPEEVLPQYRPYMQETGMTTLTGMLMGRRSPRDVYGAARREYEEAPLPAQLAAHAVDPTMLVGMGTGAGLLKGTRFAKYAPGAAKLEDIAAGGPLFRAVGKGITKVGEPIGAAVLKPFAWATRSLAPDVPHVAGLEAKMVDESIKARWGRAATKAAEFLQSQVRPARAEQAVINRAERAARFGKTVGMREAAAQEGLRGPEAFAAARPGLAGEFPKATYEIPIAEEAGKGFDRQTLTDVYEIVRNANIPEGEKWATTDALNMAFGIEMVNGEVVYTGLGRAPGMMGIARIAKVIGPELANAVKSTRTLGQKVHAYALEAVNLPRAIVAAYDYSAPLRQGLFMMGARPKGWAAASKRGVRWMFDPEYAADRYHYMMTSTEIHPDNPAIMERFNPGVTNPTGPIGAAEEYFQGELAEKIPLIQMSSRAYSGPLNEMRSDQFYDEIFKYEKAVGRRVNLTGEGKGAIKDVTFLEDMSNAVKVMSGRGELPGFLKKQGGLLGFALFAPRLLWSRLAMPGLLFSKQPQVRTMAAKGLAGAAVANVGLLSAVYAAGKATGEVDVELDFRSTDWGKIRVGRTRIDFLGGYQPIVRYAAQLLTGQRKTTAAGEIYPVDIKETMTTFLRTKLSPVMGAVTDVWQGTTMLGDPITGDLVESGVFWKQMEQRLVPMFIQDFADAVRQSGTFPGALLAIPGGFGASVMSYAWPSQKLDELSQQVMNQRWKDLNTLERKQFLEKSPEAWKVYTEEYIPMGVRRGEEWAEGLYETLESNREFEARAKEMIQAGVPKAKIAAEYVAYRETQAFDGSEDREPRDEQEAKMMAYFAITPDKFRLPDGTTDLDAYYEARRAYLDTVPETQEDFNQNELLKWKDPTVRSLVAEWQRANDLWSQFYELPTKLGMTPEEQEEARAALAMVRTLQFINPGMSQKQALMKLDIPASAKMLALRYSRLPSNPAREQFRRQYGTKMALIKPPEFGGALPTEVTE